MNLHMVVATNQKPWLKCRFHSSTIGRYITKHGCYVQSTVRHYRLEVSYGGVCSCLGSTCFFCSTC